MTSRLVRVLAGLVILAGLLTSCAPAALPSAQPANVQAQETARPVTNEPIETAQAEVFSSGGSGTNQATPATESVASPAAKGQVAASPVTAAPAAGAKAAIEQSSMREEIFLTGAPSFAIINRCKMPVERSGDGHAATWTASVDAGLLCLFGFGENETVHYRVLDGAGEAVVAGEGTPDNMDGDQLPSVKVTVGLAGNAPGEWKVEANGTSGTATASFDVQLLTLEGKPAVGLVVRGAGEPIAPGSQVTITAYTLPHVKTVELGVYDVVSQDPTGTQLRLHEGARLQVAAEGSASASLTLDPGYGPGAYCVIVVADQAYEPTEGLSPLGATRCFQVTKK